MSDQIRVDRGAVQQHVDDTRTNLAGLQSAGDEVDRQQAHLINQMEGGVGSDVAAGTRAATSRHGEDINTNLTNLTGRTSENTDEFITNVRGAANRSMNTLS